MANSVPGQVSAGPIDGLCRDNPGDGTLGLPDYSLVPYTYAPLLGPVDSSPQWVVDQRALGAFGGYKGNADGFGALRSVGGPRGSVMIQLIPQTTGTASVSPSRTPSSMWAPGDFAIALRHPGTSTWTAASTRAYLAFTHATNSVGIRVTTAQAKGPWDAERPNIEWVLGSALPIWDGNAHNIYACVFGQNVMFILDGKMAIPFRAPRAYLRRADGSLDTSVYGDMPSSGDFMGLDMRGTDAALWAWHAMMPASGDFFYYDFFPPVGGSPTTSYTPTTLPSGETWTRTGTVTANKDGITCAANATATFNVERPYGLLCTRWGSTFQAEGGLVFRQVDANNYYQLTSTGLYSCQGGTLTKLATLSPSISAGAHVAVLNRADRVVVLVNTVQRLNIAVSLHASGRGIGFRSPATGASTWNYVGFQPMISPLVLPTA